MSILPVVRTLAGLMRALPVVLVLSMAALGHLDHALMAASASVPSASNPAQVPAMPCEGTHCTAVRHCRIIASQFDATLSGQQRDIEAPALATMPSASTAGFRSDPLPARIGAPVPSARLYLTTARLRL
jgi:hypothetical protein